MSLVYTTSIKVLCFWWLKPQVHAENVHFLYSRISFHTLHYSEPHDLKKVKSETVPYLRMFYYLHMQLFSNSLLAHCMRSTKVVHLRCKECNCTTLHRRWAKRYRVYRASHSACFMCTCGMQSNLRFERRCKTFGAKKISVANAAPHHLSVIFDNSVFASTATLIFFAPDTPLV